MEPPPPPPRRPDPPLSRPDPTAPKRSSSLIGPLVVIFGLGSLVAIPLFFATGSMGIVVVVAGFVLMVFVHYLLWGRAMAKSVGSEDADDEDSAA